MSQKKRTLDEVREELNEMENDEEEKEKKRKHDWYVDEYLPKISSEKGAAVLARIDAKKNEYKNNLDAIKKLETENTTIDSSIGDLYRENGFKIFESVLFSTDLWNEDHVFGGPAYTSKVLFEESLKRYEGKKDMRFPTDIPRYMSRRSRFVMVNEPFDVQSNDLKKGRWGWH